MSLVETLEVVTDFLADNPAAGKLIPSTESQLIERYEVRTSVGAHHVTIDEPATIGGTDHGPSPVELALASLGSCQAITYRLWATKLGITFDDLRVTAEGDYDALGLLGIDGHGRPGFTAVRVTVTIDGPEPDRYEELRAAVGEHCPVLDLFQAGVAVTTSLVISSEP